jgi:hypothetical protein
MNLVMYNAFGPMRLRLDDGEQDTRPDAQSY